MIVTISVTDKDIKFGQSNTRTQCPVALAIERIACTWELGILEKVDVGPRVTKLEFQGRKFKFQNPSEIRQFIKRFDSNGHWVTEEPITFSVELL